MFGNDVWTGLGREETTEHPLDVPDTTTKIDHLSLMMVHKIVLLCPFYR